MEKIITVLKKELFDSIRDRRTLITAVLLPIILMPAIMIGTFKLQESQVEKAQEKVVNVGINSVESAPTLVSFLESQKFTLEVMDPATKEQALTDGTIKAYLEVPGDFEQQIVGDEPVALSLYSKSSDLDSAGGGARLAASLQVLDSQLAAARVNARGLAPTIISVIAPTHVDIATAQERGGFFIGLLLPMFVVVFSIVGGMYIAIDVSAGEKERKTLEALLLTPASRFQIVIGKFFAVAITASTTIILSLFSLYAAFRFFPPQIDGLGELTINLSLGAIGVMLAIGVILAIMFSGMLLSVAIFAKSYKEAQNYITPFYLLAILPVAIVAQIPGFRPTELFFAIPGINAVFVMKEVLLGTYDWSHLIMTLGSLLFFAVIGIIISGKIYSKEGILFRD